MYCAFSLKLLMSVWSLKLHGNPYMYMEDSKGPYPYFILIDKQCCRHPTCGQGGRAKAHKDKLEPRKLLPLSAEKAMFPLTRWQSTFRVSPTGC